MTCRSTRTSRVPGLTHRDADWSGLRVLVVGLGVSRVRGGRRARRAGRSGHGVSTRRRRTRSRERAAILDILGVDVRLGAGAPGRACPRTPSSSSPRRACRRRRTRCSSRPPRAASRSGARSSWPGGCARRAARRRGSRVTGTNGKTTTVNMLASILRAAGLRATSRRQRRHAAARGGAAPEPVRRPRGRAVQLPAALAALGRPPVASARAQRRARPPRLARLARGVPARQGPDLRAHPVACVYNVADPAPSSWSWRPTSSRAAGRSASPSASRRRPWSGSSTTCSPTAPSSSSDSTRPPSWAPWPTCSGDAPSRAAALRRQRAGRGGARPRATASAPIAVRDGLRAFRPDPHRIADVADGRRRAVRRRLQGDQPARRARPRCVVRAASSGSPAACSRAPTFDELVAEVGRPAARRRAHRRRPGRASPRRWPDTRPTSRSSTSPATRTLESMDRRRRRRPPRLAQPGDAVLLAPAARVDGHVRQLRRARRRLRGGRATPLRAEGRESMTSTATVDRRRPTSAASGGRRGGTASRALAAASLAALRRARVAGHHATTCCSAPRRCSSSSAWSWSSPRRASSRSATTARPTRVFLEPAALRRGRRRRRRRRRPACAGPVVATPGRLSLARRPIALQAAVFMPRLGVEVNGNRNWLRPRRSPAPAVRVRQARARPRRRRHPRQQAAAARPAGMHAVLPFVVPIGAVILALVLVGPRPRDGAGPHARSSRALLFVVGRARRGSSPSRSGAGARRGRHGPRHASSNRMDRITHLAGPGTCSPTRTARAASPCTACTRWPTAAGGASASAASQGEVEVAPRGPQRLHLRDHRRGARAARHPR